MNMLTEMQTAIKIYVNSYEEFLELYQVDKQVRFQVGGTTENPTGIGPEDNHDFTNYPGSQILKKEDDGSYTEYLFEGGRYVSAGNSNAPLHSESDTSPIVTKNNSHVRSGALSWVCGILPQ